ncbi:MAG TPA: hypothetical protein VGG45_00925 [Terracidiphilus sp.]
MRKILPIAVAMCLLIAPQATPTQTQTSDQDAAKNAAQAHAALDAMVQALGGPLWLNMNNMERHGHIAVFYQGNPDPGTTEYFEFHQWPDHDRIEYTKHRDVVQFYLGRQAWEVTYRGKKPLDKEISEDYLRRRDHSIETAVKVWMKNPGTILLYEGQRMAERHLGEQVTLISPENESITILLDLQTHLPLARTFQWRDPVYHDKNTDTEEYDDYHTIQGFPTPFTITRLKNGDPFRQYFVDRVSFNQNFPADFWDPDAVAKKIKK